jgi:hypothetical protein
MSKILYDDKVKVKESGLPEINTGSADNFNEIKNAINDNDDRIVAIESGATSELTQITVEWISGFSFSCSGSNIPVDNTLYNATPSTVTLNASDPTLERRDLIVFIAPIFPVQLGAFGFIEGVAGSGVFPDYDPSLVYPVKDVIIPAAATEPEDTQNITVFTEGAGEPGEWNFSSNNANVAVTANDPHTGINSVEFITGVKGQYAQFATTTNLDTSAVDLISFWIKLKEPLQRSFIYVRFLIGTTPITDAYRFNNLSNNLDPTSLDWQKINIDGSKLNLPSGVIDNVQIYPYKTFAGMYLDDVTIGKGSGTIPVFSGIEEAPIDGKQYGRQDKQWSEVVAGVLPDSVGLTEEKDELKGRVDMGTGLAIDWILGISYIHDILTGNITLTDSNLPSGTDTKTITLDVDLSTFSITFPLYYTFKGGDVSASGKTRIVIDCVNGTTSSEEVYYTLIANA